MEIASFRRQRPAARDGTYCPFQGLRSSIVLLPRLRLPQKRGAGSHRINRRVQSRPYVLPVQGHGDRRAPLELWMRAPPPQLRSDRCEDNPEKCDPCDRAWTSYRDSAWANPAPFAHIQCERSPWPRAMQWLPGRSAAGSPRVIPYLLWSCKTTPGPALSGARGFPGAA
jgi:hypothetical protein